MNTTCPDIYQGSPSHGPGAVSIDSTESCLVHARVVGNPVEKGLDETRKHFLMDSVASSRRLCNQLLWRVSKPRANTCLTCLDSSRFTKFTSKLNLSLAAKVGDSVRRLEVVKLVNWKDSGVLLAVVVFFFSYPPPGLALGEGGSGTLQDDMVAFQLTGQPHGMTSQELVFPVRLPPAITPAVSTPSSLRKVKTVQVLHPVASSSGKFLAKVFQHFGGGGIAGAIGAAVVYPLDTIKTRMQAQKTDDEYKDELDCFKKLVANEGVSSLYSGLIPQLLGIAPEKALKLTVNELLLELLEQVLPAGTGLWLIELIAGSGGGFSQVVFTNPMEIVKVRLQTQSRDCKQKGLLEVVKELGLAGLYHGAGVTLARDIPSNGIFFACYAILKQLYPDQSFADSFLAAIPATLVSNPMDVVKTRLQMTRPDGETPNENAWTCMRSVWIKEGPNALLKGSRARVIRTSPQFGITFLVYNFLCSLQ